MQKKKRLRNENPEINVVKLISHLAAAKRKTIIANIHQCSDILLEKLSMGKSFIGFSGLHNFHLARILIDIEYRRMASVQ